MAEDYARRVFGIEHADYRDASPAIATIVNDALALCHAARIALPRSVVINETIFGGGPREVARLLPSRSARLEINTRHEYWQGTSVDIARRASRLGRDGIWSTGDPRHPIVHELGHLAHWIAFRASWDDEWGDRGGDGPEQRTLAGQVSRRAAYSPAEFIAEVFAGLVLGRRYPEDVVQMLEQYGRLHP